MNALRIELAGDGAWILPGGRVEGAAAWQLAGAPEALELRLFWFTRGKGTEEAEIVDRLHIAQPGPRGERSFSFAMPEGPYSFSGSLISLVWALELVAQPSNQSQILQLVVAPTPVEVDIRTLREM